MQGPGDENVLARMAERRLVCGREIHIQQQRIDSLRTLSMIRFDSAKSDVRRAIQLQEKLGKLKGELRKAEDAVVKILSVKTRKDANRMTMMESISATKSRVEELKGLVEDQRGIKSEYAAIISQQVEASKAYGEKLFKNRKHAEQIEEAISWYNKVLGLRIECCHGVKFIFTNIDGENPNEEYSFIIRHENAIYTLLDCDPYLNDTKEMVNELNRTNGLFEFVRTMREKFQESATPAGYIGWPTHIYINLSRGVSSEEVRTLDLLRFLSKRQECWPARRNFWLIKKLSCVVIEVAREMGFVNRMMSPNRRGCKM